jgi:hypothetical protein
MRLFQLITAHWFGVDLPDMRQFVHDLGAVSRLILLEKKKKKIKGKEKKKKKLCIYKCEKIAVFLK